MNNKLREKVLRYGSVDTSNYRYVVSVEHNADKQWLEIKRLPLAALNTTAAITDWEVVETIGK